MTFDLATTPTEENARTAFLAEVAGRRALWLHVSGGAMDVGWAGLATEPFRSEMAGFVRGGDFRASVECLIIGLQDVLDAAERDRKLYFSVAFCAIERGSRGWSIARIGAARIFAFDGPRPFIVGEEDVVHSLPVISTCALMPAMRWTVDGVSDDSETAARMRDAVRFDACSSTSPNILVVSHPWWVDVSMEAVTAAISEPRPARHLFERCEAGSGSPLVAVRSALSLHDP